MNLRLLGWNDNFSQAFNALSQPSLEPARILSVDRSSYNLGGDFGETVGKISGRYWYSTDKYNIPAVGDWVAASISLEDSVTIIHELLPRVNCISRKTAGEITEAQVIASNVDTVFIITGLDNNFNLRRIERYITLIKNNGIQPVILLNKSDLIDDTVESNEIRKSVESIALDVPMHFISVLKNIGLSELSTYLSPGKTIALVGSSGVGKSTLTNHFLGFEQQRVIETRENDSRGRHATTRRQLFLLPSGCMLIDTPGMREIQLWIDEDNFDSGFTDIESVKKYCRFNDCTHNNEPGCAIQRAINQGEMDTSRLNSYNKMKREFNYLKKRQNETGWDSRLADRQFGKLRNSVLKARGKRR